jgi:putative MATE family efflux protein
MTKDKKFYRTMICITLPIALQNLITFGVSMIDTLMLGALGEIQLSAAALSNNLFFVFTVLNFGIAGGSNILISQYWGKGDIVSIRKVLNMMYRVSISVALIFVVIAVFAPTAFLKIFTTDPLVIAEGVKYLRIVCIGFLFYGVTNCTIMILRSVQTVKIAIVVYSVSLIINAFFNWVLIFGHLGFPALGVSGAAIATVIARLTECAIVLIFMVFIEKKICLRFSHFGKVDPVLKKDYFTTCLPVIFNELLWSVGSFMLSIVVGRMGTEVVAANSINSVTTQFATTFIYGMSSATSVMIGNTIGEGKYQKAQEYALTITVIAALLGAGSGCMIYFLRPFIVSLYNISEVTRQIAMNILSVTAVIVFFQCMSHTTLMGILRGGGDVRFVLVMDVIFMWCVAIPLGFISAFVWKWPIAAVFVCIKLDEVLKVIGAFIRLISGKWVTDVTRQEYFAEEKVLE